MPLISFDFFHKLGYFCFIYGLVCRKFTLCKLFNPPHAFCNNPSFTISKTLWWPTHEIAYKGLESTHLNSDFYITIFICWNKWELKEVTATDNLSPVAMCISTDSLQENHSKLFPHSLGGVGCGWDVILHLDPCLIVYGKKVTDSLIIYIYIFIKWFKFI